MTSSYFHGEQFRSLEQLVYKLIKEIQGRYRNIKNIRWRAWLERCAAILALLVDTAILFHGWSTVLADQFGEIAVVFLVIAILKAMQVATIVFLFRSYLRGMDDAGRRCYLNRTVPMGILVVVATGLVFGLPAASTIGSQMGGDGNALSGVFGNDGAGWREQLSALWADMGEPLLGAIYVCLSVAVLLVSARIAALALFDAEEKFKEIDEIEAEYSWRKDLTARFEEAVALYEKNLIKEEALANLEAEMRAFLSRLIMEYRGGLFEAEKVATYVHGGEPTDDPKFVTIEIDGRRERIATASIDAAVARMPACEASANAEQADAAVAEFLRSHAATAIRWKEPVSC